LELLRYLASHVGQIVSREEILSQIWHLNPARVATRTIDMHVAFLRDKLGEDGRHPKALFTVRGKGYMLKQDSRMPAHCFKEAGRPRHT
jgi:DNA-binding response OmpR family regulator